MSTPPGTSFGSIHCADFGPDAAGSRQPCSAPRVVERGEHLVRACRRSWSPVPATPGRAIPTPRAAPRLRSCRARRVPRRRDGGRTGCSPRTRAPTMRRSPSPAQEFVSPDGHGSPAVARRGCRAGRAARRRGTAAGAGPTMPSAVDPGHSRRAPRRRRPRRRAGRAGRAAADRVGTTTVRACH